MNAKPEIAIFKLPRRIRNFFLELDSRTSLPIIAACPEPREGSKLHRGATRKLASEGRMSSFLSSLNSRDCFGICCFLIMLVIKLDDPNKPDSNGKRLWLRLRFIVANPKNPDNEKIKKLNNLFLSRNIR